ncbi:MAG: proline racemase family protein [Candidatus Methanomethyliaceae archaeon]
MHGGRGIFTKCITVVDTHTAGEPTRIWLDGPRNIPGNTMKEKRDWFVRNCDWVRTFLLQEPRGHKGMCGALLTENVTPSAIAGVIFMDNYRYMDMCGHATIGVATVMLKLGLMLSPEHEAKCWLDTPAGTVEVRFKTSETGVEEIAFRNVESFFYDSVKINMPGIGNLSVDMAYGGMWFILVDATLLDIHGITPDKLPLLKQLAIDIVKIIDSLNIPCPETEGPLKFSWVQIYDESETPPKNVVLGIQRDISTGRIIACNKVDRSPCGTGLSAKLSVLFKKGLLKPGQDYWYQSIIGTQFCGRIVAVREKGVVPEIIGKAFITGINHLILDAEDPLPFGFLLPGG